MKITQNTFTFEDPDALMSYVRRGNIVSPMGEGLLIGLSKKTGEPCYININENYMEDIIKAFLTNAPNNIFKETFFGFCLVGGKDFTYTSAISFYDCSFTDISQKIRLERGPVAIDVTRKAPVISINAQKDYGLVERITQVMESNLPAFEKYAFMEDMLDPSASRKQKEQAAIRMQDLVMQEEEEEYEADR